MCSGEFWRLLRGAWQPAFSSAALSGYLPLMSACGLRLAQQLQAVAAEAAEKKEGEEEGKEEEGKGEEKQGGQAEGGQAEGVRKGEGGGARPAAGYVDVWRALGGMTLQVVGSTAYG